MQEQLRRCRVYLFTGTQPASYTLGLMEAMMTGIPVVSIGAKWMQILPYGPEIFEAPEITGLSSNEPGRANQMLAEMLVDEDLAAKVGAMQRERAIQLFGKAQIQKQWADYLSRSPVRSAKLEAVAA
jgi:glycosyltransferase involved in cell wall biosynthesis